MANVTPGTYNPMNFGAVGNGTTNDTVAIQRMFDNVPAGAKIEFPAGKTFNISGSVTISVSVQIEGYGATIKTDTSVLQSPLFLFDTVDNWTLRGLTFNLNSKNRTAVQTDTCDRWSILDCVFTGYVPANPYYHATDSAMLIQESTVGLISGCKVYDWGYQSAVLLNRCVTLNDTTVTQNVTVANCHFINVCQGVIINGGYRNSVQECVFDGVLDNCVYYLNSGDSCVIANNSMNNGEDESIVVIGDNAIITGNYIQNSPNKAIAIGGSLNNLTISGNVFDNATGDTGAFIAWRAEAYFVQNMTVSGNTFRNSATNGAFIFFYFGDVDGLVFDGNTMELETSSGQRVFQFLGNTARGRISNNFITVSNSATKVCEITDGSTLADIAWFNNDMPVGRVYTSNGLFVQGAELVSSQYGGPRVRRSIVYNTAAPTAGSWIVGDICWNLSPSINGILLWRCTSAGTPGTWEAVYGGQGGTNITETTGASNANYYYPICTITLTQQLRSASCVLLVSKANTSDSASHGYGLIQFGVKQQAAMGAAPIVVVDFANATSSLIAARVTAVTTTNDVNSTVVTLYIQNGQDYESYRYSMMNRNVDSSVSDIALVASNTAGVAALPAGTQTVPVAGLSVSPTTGLATANNGLTSTAGTTTLGVTNLTVGPWTFSETARTSGASTTLSVSPGNSTGQTASTEVSSFVWDAFTRTWAAGALTLERELLINAPTYAFASASTVADAATVAITSGPIAGTNATITKTWALVIGTPEATTTVQGTNMFGMFGAGSATMVLRNTTDDVETVLRSSTAGIFGTASNHDLLIRTNNTTKVTLTTGGNLCIGATAAGTTAAGVLALSNSATAPTASTDLAQLYSVDLSAGNATLGIYTERAVAADAAVVSTHSLTVKINGTNYRILLAT